MFADLHADTFYKCFEYDFDFSDNRLHINQNNSRKITPYIQTFAHYIPECVENKFDYFKKMLEKSLEIIENTESLVLFKNILDIQKAEKENKTLAVLSVEGGNFFKQDSFENLKIINFLESNYIRFFSLCYNNGSNLCGGAYSPENQGFSQAGLKIANSLCEHNIFVDVSHLNHKSTMDVLNTNLKVIATHSNCYSICKNRRNLSDCAIIKLIEKDSLIGINLYAPFVSDTDANLHALLKHINHIKSFGGSKNIAFGCDFDGCDDFVVGFDSLTSVYSLYDKIDEPDAMFYNNIKNFLINKFK